MVRLRGLLVQREEMERQMDDSRKKVERAYRATNHEARAVLIARTGGVGVEQGKE